MFTINQFLLISILISLNALFVATEMALARVRRIHIEQLADEGNKSARLVLNHLDNPERFISACQLGITLATLVLGAVGEATLASSLTGLIMDIFNINPQIHIAISSSVTASCYVVAFITTAFLQTIFGELVPKTYAYERAEKVILVMIHPIEWWCYITNPFISLLNQSSNLILKLLRVEKLPKPKLGHTEEELRRIVTASHEDGVLEPDEEEMLHSVFDFADTVASEVMTPRTDMTCIEVNTTINEFVEIALEHGHSRIPVYEKNIDNILGVIHIRDGLRALLDNKQQETVSKLVRKVLIVPENKYLGDLLSEFKKSKCHMAIVVDEYGGTGGLVTFEDLLEELVGDIADESDVVEEWIVENPDGSLILDAKIDLEEVNEKLKLDINDEEFNTLAGHVFGKLGKEPQLGDEIESDRYVLKVFEADRHRIVKLKLIWKDDNNNGDESKVHTENKNNLSEMKEIESK